MGFGPLLWLRPSARDRRLAALRAAARAQGLRVEMRRYPKVDLLPEERVTAGGRALGIQLESAVYLRALDTKLRLLPSWRILRASNGLPALPGWVFALDEKPDHAGLRALLESLAPLVEQLPESVRALECGSLELGVYWLEPPGSGPVDVERLAQWLGAAAGLVAACETSAGGPGNG